MPFNNISSKKFAQNACQGYICYNDHTYKVNSAGIAQSV